MAGPSVQKLLGVCGLDSAAPGEVQQVSEALTLQEAQWVCWEGPDDQDPQRSCSQEAGWSDLVVSFMGQARSRDTGQRGIPWIPENAEPWPQKNFRTVHTLNNK